MEDLIKKAVNNFLNLDKNKPIRIITHNDCDGLTSGAIISKALIRGKWKFVINAVKQLDEATVINIFKESYETFIFTDLGSGYLRFIKKHLKDKKVFIFDHHELDDYSTENFNENIVHVNPKIINENDYSYVSGAGVVYMFVKNLNKENINLAYLALTGALGDVQDLNKGINKVILEDAVKSKKIEIKKGLKLFGYQSRAIHKVLQYSTDPFIPGISGNEDGALKFINEIGIEYFNGKEYRKLTDLNKEEMQKLIAGIIIKRIGFEKEPEDVIGDLYTLKDEEDGSIIKDAREFSTVLNCCGKLDAFGIGIGLCFGNKNIKSRAEDLLKNYRLEIIKGLNHFYNNRESFVKDGYIFFNARDNINDNIISTLATILSKNNEFSNMIIICSVYRNNEIKISARVGGNLDVDLREILTKIVSDNGIVGGHKMACGGLINRDKEDIFMERIFNVIDNMEIKQRQVL